MPARELTPQQEAFVANYVSNGFNATKAALDAHYSPNNANPQAARLLAKASIQTAIQRKQAAITVHVEYSHAAWLRDQLDYQREARSAGAWGAVGKFSELIGRHIGALTSDRRLNRDEAEFFTYLGEQMEKHRQLRDAGEAGKQQARELPLSQDHAVAE